MLSRALLVPLGPLRACLIYGEALFWQRPSVRDKEKAGIAAGLFFVCVKLSYRAFWAAR